MANEADHQRQSEPSIIYQIRLRGHLGPPLTTWFGDLTVTHEADGNTRLTGPLVDQAALHGLLKRVRDLGIPLLSVNRIDEL